MTKIIGIGNALVDVLTILENDNLLDTLELPKGSMQLVDEKKSSQIQNHSKDLDQQMASGGSAANTIHGLAKLGVETAFIGTIGKDSTGDFFHNDLIKNNITPNLIKSNSPSGIANTLISKDGERTFGTFLGAAVELGANNISEEQFSGFHILHVEGYLVQNHELLEAILKTAKQNSLLVSIDLASYNVVDDNLEFLKDMVSKYVDIVFANEEEAKSFTGYEPEAALNEISKVCDIAIVKTGGKGSMIKQGDNIVTVGVKEIEPMDTTGAGDLYAAGFLFGLVNNFDFKRCGEIGTLLASTVIQNIGAKISDEKWESIIGIINN
jgi:sugar/nucleoside kinase (ribokinase family)